MGSLLGQAYCDPLPDAAGRAGYHRYFVSESSHARTLGAAPTISPQTRTTFTSCASYAGTLPKEAAAGRLGTWANLAFGTPTLPTGLAATTAVPMTAQTQPSPSSHSGVARVRGFLALTTDWAVVARLVEVGIWQP